MLTCFPLQQFLAPADLLEVFSTIQKGSPVDGKYNLTALLGGLNELIGVKQPVHIWLMEAVGLICGS